MLNATESTELIKQRDMPIRLVTTFSRHETAIAAHNVRRAINDLRADAFLYPQALTSYFPRSETRGN